MSGAGRADARRNRSRLLAVARSEMDRHREVSPTPVSAKAIARAAGVGTATLYRHFPTRGHLVVAVAAEALSELARLAGDLAAALPAEEAVRAWVEELVLVTGQHPGLAAVLLEWDDGAASCPALASVRSAVERLWSGAFRDDVCPHELWVALAAVPLVAGTGRPGREHAPALLDLVLAGLARPQARAGAASETGVGSGSRSSDSAPSATSTTAAAPT